MVGRKDNKRKEVVCSYVRVMTHSLPDEPRISNIRNLRCNTAKQILTFWKSQEQASSVSKSLTYNNEVWQTLTL